MYYKIGTLQLLSVFTVLFLIPFSHSSQYIKSSTYHRQPCLSYSSVCLDVPPLSLQCVTFHHPRKTLLSMFLFTPSAWKAPGINPFFEVTILLELTSSLGICVDS